MSKVREQQGVSRREALALVASGALTVATTSGCAETSEVGEQAPKPVAPGEGAGSDGIGWGKPGRMNPPGRVGWDPDMADTAPRWSYVLDMTQVTVVGLLVDLILPGDGGAPNPSEVGVVEFINEWVSAPYDAQAVDRAVILPGLEALGALFSPGGAADRNGELAALRALLEPMMAGESRGAISMMMERLRWLTVIGYYSSEPGWADLGYIGNKAGDVMAEPPPEVLRHFGVS